MSFLSEQFIYNYFWINVDVFFEQVIYIIKTYVLRLTFLENFCKLCFTMNGCFLNKILFWMVVVLAYSLIIGM